MKFGVTLDRDEDGIWISECPAIPDCVSQGSTRDEALANIREAIDALKAASSKEPMNAFKHASGIAPGRNQRKLLLRPQPAIGRF
jgi:predicted RNase H-like HicB family nuclease